LIVQEMGMRRSGWIIGFMASATLLAGVGWWWQRPLLVDVVQARTGPAIEAVYASGTVEAGVMLPIAPRNSGRIEHIRVGEGDVVAAGQVLVQLDDQDLADNEAELSARAEQAQLLARRNQDLFQQGFLSAAERDRSQTEATAAQAALRRSRAQRAFLQLRAPAVGTILRRDAEPGQFVNMGQTLLVLACCAPLRISAEVDEEDINRVAVGQTVWLRADALPGQTLQGRVQEITPKGDPVSRSYRVRISLLKPEQLKVGMTVEANIVIRQVAKTVLVPSAAVQAGQVWVLRQEKIQAQAVRTGISTAEQTEILSGLAAGDAVITSPLQNSDAGRRARARHVD
jgi:RND family efflux transporter MFP subunit